VFVRFDHVARDIVNADHRITFRYVRHPNYLGEMMIYGSFALMVWHWLPFAVLAWVWIRLFAVNIRLKEASMSRYPEWEQYKRHTCGYCCPW
jgi:protein-S-isoprenylcysteine O-methyltransferase Ste14